MVLTERLALLVSANTRGATRELDKLGRSAKTNLGQAETGIQSFVKSARNAAPAIGAAMAAAGVAFVSLSNSARDLSSATGALEAVFGDASGSVKDFAEEAEALGLSQTSASQVAAKLGGSLKALGFSAGEAGTLVKQLTTRAADLSVGFGSTEQALDAIAALLRGERDPIEQFAVAIKQSDINARLAAQGLSGLEGESRKLAEAQAALDLLFSQTADRVGLYGSEANEAAAAQSELRAKVENLQAELGMALLPVMIELVDVTNNVIDVSRDLGVVFGDVASGAASAADDVADFGLALAGLPGGVDLPDVGRFFDGFSLGGNVIGGVIGPVRDLIGLANANESELSLEPLARAKELADRLVPTLNTVADAIWGVVTASEEQSAVTGDINDLFTTYIGSLDQGSASGSAYANSQRAISDAAERVRDAQIEVANATILAFDATEAARQGIADYAAEQRAAVDPVFRFIRALDRQQELLAQAAAGPTATVDASGVQMDQAQQPSLLDLAQGAAGVQQAAIGLAGAIRTGDLTIDQLRGSLAQFVRQGSLTEAQAADLASAVEEAVEQAVELEGATVEAAAAAGEAEGMLAAQQEQAERLEEAQDRLADAQDAYTDAVNRSREAGSRNNTTQQTAIEKALELDRKQRAVNDALRENPNLVTDVKNKLDDLVQRGLLPANEAASVFAGFLNDIDGALRGLGTQEALELAVRLNLQRVPEDIAEFNRMLTEGIAIGAISELPGGIPFELDFNRHFGGPIPGNRGQAVPFLGHGGEYVLSADVVDRIKRGGQSIGMGGGGSGANINVTVNHYGSDSGVDRAGRVLTAVASRTGLG